MELATAKGIVIGRGFPKLIVPVMPKQPEEALGAVREALEAKADCVELRLDFLEDAGKVQQAVALCQAVSQAAPQLLLLATFRSEGQGGQATLPDDSYCDLVYGVIASGAVDLVDIEIGIGDDAVIRLCDEARAAGVIPVVSHHDFERTPERKELQALLSRMVDLGAGICKFAVMANGPADALHVMEVTEAFSREDRALALTMAMGPWGGITRLTGELFGSCMTFCSLGKPSAPGQVQLDKARRIMQDIHGVSF